jgi:hypothetical protein
MSTRITRTVAMIALVALMVGLLVPAATAQTVVGGSDLINQSDAGQIAAWLGQGPVNLTRIFSKVVGDGQFASDFHAAADGMGPTITIYRARTYPSEGTYSLIGG